MKSARTSAHLRLASGIANQNAFNFEGRGVGAIDWEAADGSNVPTDLGFPCHMVLVESTRNKGNAKVCGREVGRMVISGRLADVCAALEGMAVG